MSNQIPTADDVKEQATDNLGAGIAGGIGVLVGTSLLGSGMGPIAGGVIAGATQSNQSQADAVTISGMMQGFNNMVSTTGNSNTQSENSGVM